MSVILDEPTRLNHEELLHLEEVIEGSPQEIRNSFQVAKEYYHGRIRELCREGVADAAAFLDEHVLGWADRVKRPLNMSCVHDCVLGQVFDPRLPENQPPEPPRRFFGLVAGRKERPRSSGFLAGAVYLESRGYNDAPFVFSANEAIPFWEAEIARRA